jgi:WD40 repeat protein
VQAVVFDTAGGTVATLGDDREVILSEAASGKLVERFSGHSGQITSGAFARDGRTLYTSSLDSSVIAWDVTGDRQLGSYFSGSRGTDATWMTVSSAGVVAVTREDGSVRFWDADGGRPLGPAVTGTKAGILAASFSPDGRQLVTGALGGTVLLWDVGKRTATTLIDQLPGDANEVVFSPDGRLVAICVYRYDKSTIRFVDVATRRQVGEPIDVGWGMPQLAWSPDSQRVGVASFQQPDADVYDVRTHRRIWSRKVAPDGASWSFAWSPDGSSVAVGDGLGRIHLWDASNGRDVRPPVAGHAGPTVTFAFSPDGSLLATAGTDGTVILFDVSSGRQVGRPLPASDNTFTVARFDPRGRLFVGSGDGAVWRWDVDVTSWLRRACAVAGRDLDRAEWADLGTGQDYAQVCA